ncbi:MAG: hypothetical protein QMD80_08925, partial [archaeon]|nr:hypothetical protein [archaeon]
MKIIAGIPAHKHFFFLEKRKPVLKEIERKRAKNERKMNIKVTKRDIAEKISAYLNRSITLEQMVDWAENMICEAEYEEKDFELIKEVLSHLGLADVKEFGLSWDDCYNYLSRLGYQVKVSIYSYS